MWLKILKRGTELLVACFKVVCICMVSYVCSFKSKKRSVALVEKGRSYYMLFLMYCLEGRRAVFWGVGKGNLLQCLFTDLDVVLYFLKFTDVLWSSVLCLETDFLGNVVKFHSCSTRRLLLIVSEISCLDFLLKLVNSSGLSKMSFFLLHFFLKIVLEASVLLIP